MKQIIPIKKTLLLSLAFFLLFTAFPIRAYGKTSSSSPCEDAEEISAFEETVIEGFPDTAEEIRKDTETETMIDSETEPSNTDIAKYKEALLTINKTGQTADSFQGVDALYRPGGSDGSDPTYSCAAYIKKYYLAIYKAKVDNLFYQRTPNAIGSDFFVKVAVPQAGDIAACDIGHSSTHWAIVKQAGCNDTVILIEQNWKWLQNGVTMSAVNRTINNSSVRFYRLNSENEKIAAAKLTVKK